MTEYDPEFGLPGAATFSVSGVPASSLGKNGDRANSQNGNQYLKSGGIWSVQSAGSIQDSRISCSAAGTIAPGLGGEIGSLVVDDVAGSDLTLDSGGVLINILTPGLYYAQAGCGNPASSTLDIAVNGNTNPDDGGSDRSPNFMFRVTDVSSPATVFIQLTAGANPVNPGIDVFRLA